MTTSPTLAAVAADGVHEPGYMPFSIPWTEGGPGDSGSQHLAVQLAAACRVEARGLAPHVGDPRGRRGRRQPRDRGHELRHHQDRRDRLVARAPTPGTGHRQGDARRGAALRVRRSRGRGRAERRVGRQRPLPRGQCGDGLRAERRAHRRSAGRRRPARPPATPRQTWEARRRDDICIEGLDACRAEFGI